MQTQKVCVSSACMTRSASFADRKSGRLKKEIEYLSSNKAVVHSDVLTMSAYVEL